MCRFRFCQELSRTMTRNKRGRKRYEAENILERWILTLVEEGGADSVYRFNGREATYKMISELDEKGLTVEMLTLFTLSPEPERPVSSWLLERGAVIVDGARFPCSPKRLQLLSSMALSVDVAKTVVRYACLFSRGQQWSIPSVVYRILVDRLKVDLEGFASPLNSKILELGGRFCSLFPDTDSIFGSVGDFFSFDLRNQSAVVNPPFIVTVMDRMVEKLTTAIEQSESCLFVVFVPSWTDTEYYKRLTCSRYRLVSWRLLPGQYYYEDLDDKRIDARFESSVFILGTDDRRRELMGLKEEMSRAFLQ